MLGMLKPLGGHHDPFYGGTARRSMALIFSRGHLRDNVQGENLNKGGTIKVDQKSYSCISSPNHLHKNKTRQNHLILIIPLNTVSFKIQKLPEDDLRQFERMVL